MTKDLIRFENEELPINLEPAKIDFPKYEELKKRVDRLTDSLKDYVVTEDSYEQDKKTRAELNRIQKALSKKRIEIFNEAVEPANEFKQQVSGLEKQIKYASDRISEGIKHYTDKEKDAKFQEIKLRLGNLALKYNVSIQLLGDIRKRIINLIIGLIRVVRGKELKQKLRISLNQKLRKQLLKQMHRKLLSIKLTIHYLNQHYRFLLI